MTDDPTLPSLEAVEARLAQIRAMDPAALEAEQIAILGRKSGALTAAMRRIP